MLIIHYQWYLSYVTLRVATLYLIALLQTSNFTCVMCVLSNSNARYFTTKDKGVCTPVLYTINSYARCPQLLKIRHSTHF